MNQFTPRQRQVLLLIAQGLTLKQIAESLGITVGCAKDHFDLAKDKIPLARGTRNRVLVVNWINKNLGESDGEGSCRNDGIQDVHVPKRRGVLQAHQGSRTGARSRAR